MKLRLALVALLVTLAPWAMAQEQAFTNRTTDLKESAAAESKTLKSLGDNTEVKVLQRSGGWTRVDAGGQQGWVRVFHLRFPASASADSSSGGALSGLGSALGFGRQRSQSTTIATTGIRGLSQEDLKNSAPDAAELQKMQSFRADNAAAERFAREGKLAATPVDNPEGRR